MFGRCLGFLRFLKANKLAYLSFYVHQTNAYETLSILYGKLLGLLRETEVEK
jgi:hypothetical protein